MGQAARKLTVKDAKESGASASDGAGWPKAAGQSRRGFPARRDPARVQRQGRCRVEGPDGIHAGTGWAEQGQECRAPPAIFGIMNGCYPGRGVQRGGRRDFMEWGGMGPHLMDVVVEGKRYRTATATLLASGPGWTSGSATSPAACSRSGSAASTSRRWWAGTAGSGSAGRPFCFGRQRATTSCSSRALGPVTVTGSSR
jgi:hypothetical protein